MSESAVGDEAIDPRRYQVLFGIVGADRVHVWDCGRDADQWDALSGGSGALIGTFDDRATAETAMRRAASVVDLSKGRRRTYLILSDAPEHPRLAGTDFLGFADPHTIELA